MSEPTRYAALADLQDRITNRGTVVNSLESVLDAASTAIERRCSRVFTLSPEPSERRFRPMLADLANVPDIGSSVGVTVSVGGGDSWRTLTPEEFDLAPYDAATESRPFSQIITSGLFSRSVRPTLKVSARWGWPAVPADITEAVLLFAARLWSRRDSPAGVAGFGDYGVVRVTAADRDVAALLEPYELPGFGA